jgi:hypothetical protein
MGSGKGRKEKNMKIAIGKSFIGMALAAALVTGCSSKQAKPTSYQAEVVESLDGNRVRVAAVGAGDDTQEAIMDGYKAAIYRVSQDLVQSSEERIGWEGVQDEIFTNANKYVERYNIKSRRKEPHADVKLNLDIVVNRKRLSDDLVAMGVIKAQRELMSELRNPSIVVLPEDKISQASWRQFAVDQVNSYLTSRKYEVLDAKQVAKLDGMTADSRAAAGIGNDQQAAIALQLGGDIYVVFDVNVSKAAVGRDSTIKASASARAFETTTARSIGSATGFSREYAGTAGSEEKAVAEALSDAVDRVLVNVMDYWKDDAIKGFQYLVQVNGNFAGDDGQAVRRTLYRVLKESAGDLKENVATDKTLNYRVWYKGSNTDLVFGLQDKFAAASGGKKLKSVSENRKLLQFTVE